MVFKNITLIEKSKLILIAATGLLVLAISALATVFLFNISYSEEPETMEYSSQDVQKYTAEIEARTDPSFNVLLLGYGGADHDGSFLTDAIKLVNIDPVTKDVTVISIPRDLWVEIPVRSDMGEYQKINAAYAIGMDDNYPLKQTQYRGVEGAQKLAGDVVEAITGKKVDGVIAVDFAGLIDTVDALGGIEVNVPVTFDDYFYPIKGEENNICGKSPEEMERIHALYSGFELEKQFECRYEHLHFDAGINHMDGQTVLKFVRSRHSNEHGGDFARAQRQMAVLSAIKEKVLSLGAFDNVPGFIKNYTRSVTTNLKAEAIIAFLAKFPETGGYSTKSITLSDENVLTNATSPEGAYILEPRAGQGNFTDVKAYINAELEK